MAFSQLFFLFYNTFFFYFETSSRLVFVKFFVCTVRRQEEKVSVALLS